MYSKKLSNAFSEFGLTDFLDSHCLDVLYLAVSAVVVAGTKYRHFLRGLLEPQQAEEDHGVCAWWRMVLVWEEKASHQVSLLGCYQLSAGWPAL